MENLITNFDYKKLEFDKILNRINKYCLSLEGVNSINNTIPSNNKDKIIHEHNLVIALRKYLEKEEKLNLSIIYNFKKQIDSSNKGITLNEIQLYELAFSVKEYFYIKKRLFIEGYEIFHSLFKVDKLEDDFYIDILKYIDHDGNIDSKASSELKNIRSGIIEINNRIHKSANEYLRKYKEQGYVSDEIISIREGLLCIAVKSSYKNRVDGIILDTSSTGQTVFVVPNQIIKLHNDLVVLQDEEKKEILRILNDFTKHVRDNSFKLEIIDNELLIFDIVYAKTHYAIENDYYSPVITDERFINLLSGIHPLLGEKAVPLDINIGKDFKILVITGPNTGGKTVVLKTLGLLVLMVQSGIPIPASSTSSFTIFKKLYIDIGDDQSIEQSLSTFSSHIKKIIDIMNNSDSESLILIDEFGTGTDPIEGASLAMSIIIKLIELKSLALMTTHYSAIKNFASNTTGVQNASMEFDGINLMPTYKLKIGIPGSSKAFEISKRLGMSDEIINRAKNFIDKDMLNVEVLQERLEKQLKEIEKEKTELNKKEMENQIIRNELENAKFQLNEKIKELDQKIRQDKTDFLKEARKEFENIVHEIKISNAAKDKIKQGKQLFDKIGEDLKHEDKKNHKSNKTFEKGDEVHVISKDVDGIIVDKSNNEGQYLVQVGILKINFDSEDLSLNKSKIKKEKSLNYYSDMPKAQITIDLRGYRYEDAEKKIDKFIEEALINKTEIIKIIHGKGTGALRNCIQDYLKNCPFVVEYNYEKLVTSNETNFGVTVARLRR